MRLLFTAFVVASLFMSGAAFAKIITCEKTTPVGDGEARLITKVRVELGEGRHEVALMDGEITSLDEEAPLDRTEKIYMPNVKCAAGGDVREFTCINDNAAGLVAKVSGQLEAGTNGARNLVVIRSNRDDRTDTYRFQLSECQVE